jgi:hypothetical protein
MPPAALEHIGEAHQVRLNVRSGILQRVAHAGLRGEVQDAVRLLLVVYARKRRGVGDIELTEAELRLRELRQPILLQPNRVVIIQVVDADHVVAARKQSLGAMHADEAGDSGDEDLHSRKLPMILIFR